jgi:hypothetical protein
LPIHQHSYKMEVFIRKGEKLLLRKFIGKGSSD